MKGNNEPISDVQTMNIRLSTYYLNLPTVILCHNNTIIHNFMTTRTVLVLVLYVINGRSSFMVAFILVHLLLRKMTVTGFKIKPITLTMTYLSCFGLFFRISYSFEQYCNPNSAISSKPPQHNDSHMVKFILLYFRLGH